MQRLTTWLATLTLLVRLAAPLAARQPGALCKQIREAVAANHTLEQILAEFDTDAKQVTKCTPKRGRRRAGPKAPQTKHAKPVTKPLRKAPAADAPKPRG